MRGPDELQEPKIDVPVVQRVQISELYASWVMADAQLFAKWRKPGGDYLDATGVANGPTTYASVTITEAKPQLLTWNVGSLVTKLLGTNTGIYLHVIGSGTLPAAWSRQGDVPPKLRVTTNQGTFDCLCIADTYLDPSSNTLGALKYMHLPAVLKFDLSAVKGTVSSATLSLYYFAFYTIPIKIGADYLDMPPLVDDPANQGYTVEQGVAASVTNELSLATHPDIIVYTNPSSLQEIQKSFFVSSAFNYISLGSGGHSFERWDDLGISAFRTWSRADGDVVDGQVYGGTPQIMRWDRWFQGKDSATGPVNAPWKRPWAAGQSLGYDEMYLRLLIEVGTDVKAGMTEGGIKLFTTNGRYEWGNLTPGIPALSDTEKFEYMLWHGPQSVANPGVYRLCTYDYDVGHSFAAFPSLGELRPTEGYLREGRRYTLEQYVKLNTIVGGVPQSNGIHKVWLDGCLVYSDTTRKIRNLPHVQIQGTQGQVYHGGVGKPSARFHYDVGGIAISTRYIGPPKKPGAAPVVLPAWVPPPGTYAEFTQNTPFDARPSTLPEIYDIQRIFVNWNSAAMISDYSPRGGIAYHGGGEHQTGSTDSCGVMMLNLDTRLYEFRCRGAKKYVQSSGRVDDPDPTNDFGEHVDGSPGAPHTYNSAVEFPTAWGGGPRGSYLRCGATPGGSTTQKSLTAFNCVHRFDLSQEVGGTSRMTGSLRYGATIDWGAYYAGATIDRKRQGWWVKLGSSAPTPLAFISKTGAVTYSPTSFTALFPSLHHFSNDGQDVLMLLYDFTLTDYMSLIDLSKGWALAARLPSGTPPALSPPAKPTSACVGDVGPKWSTIMNCFIGMDYSIATPTLYFLKPSNPANIMASTWAWSKEVVTSYDGSTIVPNNRTTDPGSGNGIWGKLIECPSLRSLVWSRSPSSKGQLIRPKGMA